MAKKLSLQTILTFILILIIAAAIYVVKGPMTNQLTSLQEEQYSLESEITSMQPYIAQIAKWQSELDALRAEKGEDLVSIPDYDNFTGIVREISEIFDEEGTTYSISYGTPYVSDSIASRSLSLSFSCKDYETSLAKLKALNESDTRYRLSNLTISSPDEGSSSVTIDLTVYEYCGTNAQ